MTTEKSAYVSEDGLYRYDLRRTWDREHASLGVIMLNPSVADASLDDATVRVLCGLAKREGYGGIVVRNLFAYRTPEPIVLARARREGADVVGPGNDQWLMALADELVTIVAAWGRGSGLPPVVFNERVAHVVALIGADRLSAIAPVRYRGPAPHPLYLPADSPLECYPVHP